MILQSASLSDHDLAECIRIGIHHHHGGKGYSLSLVDPQHGLKFITSRKFLYSVATLVVGINYFDSILELADRLA